MKPVDYILNSKNVSEWVAHKLGMQAHEFGDHYNIGITRAGRPLVGFVYNNHFIHEFGADIRVAIAADTNVPWATRDVLKSAFHLPFNELGCARITVLIKEGNTKSVNFVKKLGFRKEGVLRRGYDGKSNALIYGMLKDECRWIDG